MTDMPDRATLAIMDTSTDCVEVIEWVWSTDPWLRPMTPPMPPEVVKKLIRPTARPGTVVKTEDGHIFVPFDRKTAYLLTKKWDGWRGKEIDASEVKNWKSVTKRAGQLKQKFASLFIVEE
jgi:hypothetical protein